MPDSNFPMKGYAVTQEQLEAMNSVLPVPDIEQALKPFKDARRSSPYRVRNIEYMCVLLSDLHIFNERVNDLLADGWTLQGGVSISEHYYAQALIREKL